MTPILAVAARMSALRRSVADFLWLAVADQESCCCEPGDPGPTCRAWSALGFDGHFNHERAEKMLPRGGGE